QATASFFFVRSCPMTYSSMNFLISCGVGSDERVPRFSNRLSSAMMSLQTSTHSSQMKTVGPAISLRTSFWSLLQNEQRKTSVSPAFFTMLISHAVRTLGLRLQVCRGAGLKACTACGYLRPLPDDIINNTVFLALVRGHDVIALRIVLDTLDRLSRVLDQDVVDALTHSQDLAGCNINIGRLSGETRHQGMVDSKSGIGQGKTHA